MRSSIMHSRPGTVRRTRKLRLESLEKRLLLASDIHGLKWHDLNADGLYDPDIEPLLPDWTVYLDDDGDGRLDDNERRTQTGPNGAYRFDDLAEGTYLVSELAPNNWRQTFPGPQVSLSDTASEQIGHGAALDFRIVDASLGNPLLDDPGNGPGAGSDMPPDPAGGEIVATLEVDWPDGYWGVEPGLTQVFVDGQRIGISVVALPRETFAPAPDPWTDVVTVTLPRLEPGAYELVATLSEADPRIMAPLPPPPSWQATGEMHYRPIGAHAVEVNYATDEDISHDFGNIRQHDDRLARIVRTEPAPGGAAELVSSVDVAFNVPMDARTINEDTFWIVGNFDDDPSGIPGNGGVPIEGTVVYDATTFTATFTPFLERLPEGMYVMIVDDAVRSEAGQSLDGEWHGQLPSGDGEPGGHFVTWFDVVPHMPTGEIHGTKWEDVNGNGLRESTEPGVPGWEVYLDLNRDGVSQNNEPHARTDDHGRYAFVGVEPDTYVVAERMRPGWQQTFPGGSVELVDIASHPLEPGAALHFSLVDAQVVSIGTDPGSPDVMPQLAITVEVEWPASNYQLMPDAATYTIADGQIAIDVYGQITGEAGADVITTETQTIVMPLPDNGQYHVTATLHEPAGIMLPAFFPAWQSTGRLLLPAAGRHVVTVGPGDVVEGVDFGNRRTDDQPPHAELMPLEPITAASDDPVELIVVYHDDWAVDPETFDDADLAVIGPDGVTWPVELLRIEPTDSWPHIFVVVYGTLPPDGHWDAADNGVYLVEMQPEQVADEEGNFVPPGPLGELIVRIGDPELGAIHGTKWFDRNGDGERDPNERGLPGWTIYLDENNNGQLDLPTPGQPPHVIEADTFPPGDPIIDPAGIAVLRHVGSNTPVLAVPNPHVDIMENVFGRLSTDAATPFDETWSEDQAVLGVEFAQPVHFVSLDFMGTGLRGGYQGIMRAFDAAGNLLTEARSDMIWSWGMATLTLEVPGEQIAYVEATGAAEWIPLMIDHLVYAGQVVPGEPFTVTNEDGNYGFVGLPPGEFTVAEVLPPRWQQTAPGPQAELLETSSRQLTTDGAALDFGIVDVAAENDGRRWLALDVTLEVLWPSTAYALVPDATSVTVDGDTIFVELLGGDTGLPGLTVLTPETETVHVPRLTPGTYSVVATLNETAGPVLPAFFESWLAEGTVALRADGVHEVTLAAGEVVEGVDFGNRPRARVIRRQIFYNDSEFDGDGPAVNMLDDVVIVQDKQPLLPGEKATWANYTNYVHGINGVVVDLDGVTDPAALGADDFELRVGNDHDPSQWPAAPDPLSITIHPGDGAEGSDRVMISWADGAIVGQWLRVTVKANDDTGLDADDTFYFGNAPGESGNSDSDALVTAADIVSARDVVGLHGASIQHRYDFNRDRQVDAADSVIVRNHVTSPFNALRLIEPPGPANGQGGNGEAEPAPAVLPPVQLDALLAAPTNSGGELTNDSRPAIEPADRDAVWVELARSPLGRLLERSDAATRPGRPTLPVAATPVDEPLLERLASEWVALP